MFFWRWTIVLCGVLLLIGCESAPVATPLPVENARTVRARTPVWTNTPLVAAEQTPVADTPETTVSPAVEEATPGPVASPVPPATTPVTPPESAEAGDLTHCMQLFGPDSQQRFSARLQNISFAQSATVPQLVLEFDLQTGQLHGSAGCIPPAAALMAPSGEVTSVLQLQLPHWVHDAAWEQSLITLTRSIATNQSEMVRSITMFPLRDKSDGMLLEVGLKEAVPYSVEVDGERIVVSFGTTPALGDDPLGFDFGQPKRPTQPVIFIQAGEIWALEGDRVRAVSSTTMLESAVALSPDGSEIAFCRTDVDTLPEFGSLWVSTLDGGNERLVADVGGCVDPAWSFDGSTLWFSAPWSAIQPLSYRLWSAELASGDVRPRSELDLWSRTSPQPLPQGEVVLHGSNGQGLSTVLLLNDTQTRDLGHTLLTQYHAVADVLVAPAGDLIAVSAVRADGGADLVVLNLDGTIQAVYGTEHWWSRPLGWTADGQLYYLVATCRAGTVLSYELHLVGETDQLLLEGATLAAIGPALTIGEDLLYVRETRGTEALRGPEPLVSGPSTLWIMNPQGERQELLSTVRPVTGLQ